MYKTFSTSIKKMKNTYMPTHTGKIIKILNIDIIQYERYKLLIIQFYNDYYDLDLYNYNPQPLHVVCDKSVNRDIAPALHQRDVGQITYPSNYPHVHQYTTTAEQLFTYTCHPKESAGAPRKRQVRSQRGGVCRVHIPPPSPK